MGQIGQRFLKILNVCFWVFVFIVLYLSVVKVQMIDDINKEKHGVRLDYILHCLAYFFLVNFYKISQPNRGLLLIMRSPGIVFVIVMGIFSELVQIYLPWRSFNIIDLFMNLTGILLGIIFVSGWNNFNKQLKRAS